ncbi:TPA: LuxR C-terminal-related transcriptional regulator [Serratia marcescens]
MSSLTPSEIVMTKDVIEGNNIKRLARKYNIAYKTISAYKRTTMIKLHISSIAQ